MSGIFGIIHQGDEPVDAADMVRLRDAMAHRGPDGGDIWIDRSVGLGQLMLHSTPESLNEALPWKDPQSGLVITADARIDNREELLAGLDDFVADRGFREQGSLLQPGSSVISDSQLILAAYKRWGEACVDHLLGDFAFVIWDIREKKLFCARDRMGAASFCYVAQDRYFAFASEAEALLHLPNVLRQPNEKLIACMLVPEFENRDDHHTWQRDVYALMPSQAMTVASGKIKQKWQYWSLDSERNLSYSSDKECLEHFTGVFEAAVHCRLRTPGNTAVMMSGGLDSAAIAAMTHRLFKKNPGKTFNSYSAIDDDHQSSVESKAILSIVDSLNVRPHYVSVPSFQGMVGIDDLLEVAWTRSHPVDSMLLLPALMCLAASRDGNRVMLEGASGDVTLRLPSQYASVFLRKGRFVKAWNECVASSRNNFYLRGSSPLSLFKQNVWRAFAPQGLRKIRLRSKHRKFSSAIATSLILPDFAEKLRLAEQLEEQYYQAEPAMLADPWSPQTHQNLAYILWGLSGFSRVAARYGVEVRDPWADSRVVEFFMRLPIESMVQSGWTKYLVRRSFEQELAPEVLWRRDKEHLGWKVTDRVMAESSGMVTGVMKGKIEVLGEYVDLGAARAIFERWISTGDSISRQAVFELVTMVLWLQRIKSL